MPEKEDDLAGRFAPGILAFLGYYELVSGLQVPFNFTVNRVTYTYLFQAPLLWAFELDLIVYLTLTGTLIYRGKLKLESRWALLTIISNLMMAIGFILNAAWLSHLSLGSACLASALTWIPPERRKLALLPGILLSLLILEALSLLSLISYYALGRWNPTFFHIILRERLVWSPMEWASIIIFVVASWIALPRILLGKPLINFPKIEFAQKVDGKPKLMLILALLLTATIVILPHISTVNPQLKPVSVDTPSYVLFLKEAKNRGLAQALRSGAGGRPVYLLSIYNLWMILNGDPTLLMDLIHPLLALTALTLSSFYAAYKLNGEGSAGWAALLIPLGYAATGFLAGGYQANSVALTPALLALTVDPKDVKRWILLTALLALTGLIHPWTHLMYSAILVAHNFRRGRRFPLVVAASTLSYCMVYIVDSTLTVEYRAETPIEPLVHYAGLQFVKNWFNAIRLWIWNTLSNPIYLSTVILEPDPQTISAMGVIAPLMLLLPSGLLCRLILNLPIQLQAAKILGKAPSANIRILIILTLLVRVLGNLTGLTPLGEPPA